MVVLVLVLVRMAVVVGWGSLPTRNWRRQGSRSIFHLYHARRSGEIAFSDIAGPSWAAEAREVSLMNGCG